MKGPNSITKAIIDATVDRGLQEIQEDPRRSIRKLTDMGKQFAKGRFLQELYSMFQELLHNEDSPYYEAIENLLSYTERKAIKGFGINLGYHSLTYGGKVIRELQEKKNFRIPWILQIRIDSAKMTSLTPDDVDAIVKQGTALGIYTYSIRCEGSIVHMEEYSNLFRNNSKCAFLFFMPSQEFSQEQIALLKPCCNVINVLPLWDKSGRDNAALLRRQRSWFGFYDFYSDEDKNGWLSGERLKRFYTEKNSFAVSIARDECSEECRDEIAAFVRKQRIEPGQPVLLFDLYGDSLQFDKIIMSDTDVEEPCFLEINADGNIRTQEGLLTDFRHVITLEQMIAMALHM